MPNADFSRTGGEEALPEPPHRAAVAILARQRDEALAKVKRLEAAHADVLAHARRAQSEIAVAQTEADDLDRAIAALQPTELAKAEASVRLAPKHSIPSGVTRAFGRPVADTPQA